MKDPKDEEAYDVRFHQSQIIEGDGAEAKVSMPCPFCAAPGWIKYQLLQMKEVMARGAVCHECGRGARVIASEVDGGVELELVQTCGVDPPAYQPPVRRV